MIEIFVGRCRKTEEGRKGRKQEMTLKKREKNVSKIYPESGKEDDDSPWLTLARFLDTHVTTPRGFR